MKTKELMALKPDRHALLIMAMVLTGEQPHIPKPERGEQEQRDEDDLPLQPTNNRPVEGEEEDRDREKSRVEKETERNKPH